MYRRCNRGATAKFAAEATAQTRHAELLILCARIDFNP